MFKYGFGRITCGACSASLGIRVDNDKNSNENETCLQKDECDHFRFEIELNLNKPNEENKKKGISDSMNINLRAICKKCNEDFESCSSCTNENCRSGFKVVSGHGISCFFSYEYTSDEKTDFMIRSVRGKPNRPDPILFPPVPYVLKQSNYLDLYSRGPSNLYTLKNRV
ncbi:unnamed protein product [Brachionus calyciflorus]|uniref:Uncharacterized protein n=1 Tax=Brachionus calyciflorus TaxID=104777 RepID=A0A813Y8K1_9BILA|nr:unnamed protein product [Brachionus calyciflorus]